MQQKQSTDEVAERLAALIEALPDAIFFKDGAGRWQIVNSRGLRLFNLSGEPWQGKTDLELGACYPDRAEAFAVCHQDDAQAWERGGRFDSVERVPDPQSGELHTFAVTKIPLFEPNGERRGLVVVGHDVTERERIEAVEARQRASLRRLGEIAALSHLPLAEQLRRALEVGAAHFALEFGVIGRIEGTNYRIVAHVSPPGTLDEAKLYPYQANSCCSVTLERDTVTAIHEEAATRHLKHPCYGAIAMETYLCAPITVNGAEYGTVNFSSTRPYERQFDEGDREFMQLLARWAGSSIERDLMAQRLVDSELQLRTIIENEPECVKLLASDGTLLQMNRAGLAMIDADSLAQVAGTDMLKLVMPPYRRRFKALTNKVFKGGQGRLEFEVTSLRGRHLWLETNAVPLRNAQGKVAALLSVTRDITERKRTELALRESEQKFRGMFELSPVGIALNDLTSGRFLEFNQALLDSTGYSAAEFRQLTYWDLTPAEYEPQEAEQLAQLHSSGRYGPYEKEYIRKDGSRVPVLLSGIRVDDGDGRDLIWSVIQDISERKAAEAEIHQLAFYDPLTQLANRRLLQDRLGQAFAASARRGRHGAVMFIDLDNFKMLNDTMGHDVGDRLLVEVAQRLKVCVRTEDTVARLGGDEFVVVLENLSGDGDEAAVQAEGVAEKIRDSLNRPYALAGLAYHSTPSIGVTLFLGYGESLEDLFRHADVALYRAKNAGRNAVRFFEPSMQATLTARAELDAELRHALQGQQLQLYFQTLVDDRQRVTGAEALLRWNNPQRGMVMPGEFIPLAEETGLIVPIGHWVLQEACKQLKQWEADPLTGGLSVAVNVSGRQFHQPDFVEQVEAVLRASGADPRRLKLELTESLVLSDVADTVKKMRALQALGVGLSMDDFGTGYSSLAYLMQLPFEQLKIDQSFIRNLTGEPANRAIVQAIVTMAKSIGLQVIAEGVESAAEREVLTELGCPAFQGFLFGRPLPVKEFEQLLKAS